MLPSGGQMVNRILLPHHTIKFFFLCPKWFRRPLSNLRLHLFASFNCFTHLYPTKISCDTSRYIENVTTDIFFLPLPPHHDPLTFPPLCLVSQPTTAVATFTINAFIIDWTSQGNYRSIRTTLNVSSYFKGMTSIRFTHLLLTFNNVA